MKNLKRVLSLALATVMLLGIMVIGANAAFADQADIKYTAAVDTMVQLGVLDPNGMGNNTFAPNGTLTRAQAAKMVAYVKAGGNTTIIGYYAGSTKFSDVGSNLAWAEGSINYCVANGIVNGKSETSFDPDGQLTGAELGKMLLVALGYPTDSVKSTEALTGPNWQRNAIRMATEAGLFDDLDTAFVATKAITRQEASQVIYNALFLNTWQISEYQNATPVYKNNGPSIIVSAFKANGASADSDEFGRPGTKYTFSDGKDPILVVDKAAKTYTTPVSEQKLYNDLALTGTTKTGVTKIVDGTTVNNANLTLTRATVAPLADTGNGVLTEAYVKADGSVTLVMINTYLAKVGVVTPANAATGAKASTALTVYTADDTTVNGTFETTDFAKDSYVLVTKSSKTTANKVMSVVAAPVVPNVAVTKYSATELVAGSSYAYSAKLTANTTAGLIKTGFSFAGTYDLMLDTYGNVIGTKVYTAAGTQLNYVYVVAQDAKEQTAGLLGNTDAVVKVMGYLMDGTKTVMNVAVKTAAAPIKLDTNKVVVTTSESSTIAKDTQYVELGYGYNTSTTVLTLASNSGNNATTVKNALAEGLYSYTTNADGTVNLSKQNAVTIGTTTYTATVEDTANDTVALKQNVATLGAGANDKLANSATKVVVVDTNDAVTTISGFGSFPATAATYTIKGTPAAAREVKKVIVVDNGLNALNVLMIGAYAAAPAIDGVIAVGNGQSYTVAENGVSTDYYEYVVDGVVKGYKGATGNNLGGIYVVTFDATTKVGTAHDITSYDVTGLKATYGKATGTATVTADYVVVGTDAIVMGDVVAYNITNPNAIVADTIELGDTVTIVYDNVNGAGVLKAVAAFITAEA